VDLARAIIAADFEGVDKFEEAEKIRRKLESIVTRFHPARLKNFLVDVPFTADYVTVELKRPATLPFIIDYGFYNPESLHVDARKRQVDKITIWFGNGKLESVTLHYRSAEGDKTITQYGMLGLAYLALPEIREALKDAEIKSKRGHGERWLRNFLEHLDNVSDSDIYMVRLEDIMDQDNKINEIDVDVKNVARDAAYANIHLHPDIGLLEIKAKTMHNKEVSIGYVFYDKENTRITYNVSASSSLVAAILYVLAENDRVYDTVKRSLIDFTNAYRRALIAYGMMNVDEHPNARTLNADTSK